MYTRNAGTVTEIRRNGNYFQPAAYELSSIVARTKELQEHLPDAIFRVVVVVRPSTSSRAGGITLQISSPVGRDLLAFATPDTFEDVAGEFLAEDAYVLCIPILQKLI